MSYTPTNWQTGDIVSSEKLNKMEEGIANAHSEEYIVAETDEWLEENITQETGYVLDRSLQSANAAAPADIVGDIQEDVSDAKNAISQLQPAATQSDVGKALIIKTVDTQTGKPTGYEYGDTGGQTDIGLSVVNGQICVSYSV